MAEPEITAKLLLAEYERLKDEQRSRIGFRDSLIYAALAAMAGVITAVLSAKGHSNLLLLLPPVTALLGWTYLVNDEKVSAIGRYVREHLEPAFVRLANQPEGVLFEWEAEHRADPNRRTRKVLQLVVDVGTFCIPAWSAVIIFWVNGPRTWPFMAVSILEVLVLAGLAVQLLWYADLRRDAQSQTTGDPTG